jgi:hypothetical protein
MTRLDLLDPTRPDDPSFDPDGAQAQRVRAAAAAVRPAAPRKPPRRAPRLALGGLAATVLAAAAVVVGTTTTAPDARAALLQAAERTGAVDSGRAVYTLHADHGAVGYKADVRNEIRFSGDDFEIVSAGRETLPSGKTEERSLTYRQIDGVGYQRTGDGPWVRLGAIAPERREDGQAVDIPVGIAGRVDNEQLVELAKAADDVTIEGNTYRATVTAGEFEDAAQTTAGRPQGPAWDAPVKLELTVDDDGLIRRVVATEEHNVKTTEFFDLGEPQVIAKP